MRPMAEAKSNARNWSCPDTAAVPAPLLHEDLPTVGDAEKGNDVDVGDVDAFIEPMHGREDRYAAQPERVEQHLPMLSRYVAV